MSSRQFILLPLFCMLCACSGLGEARHTLAAADSMRVNEGRLYANGVPANNVQRLIPLPQFTDHHILARIYSNMGTMSHLADEFELSYLYCPKCFSWM